jgi:hypothetical protein
MADYQFNTNLGPAAQQNTSLADMVNLARGVQAYQQQGQLNPLQLEKAQMEVEQAKKLNPLAVRQQTAAAGTAELGLNEKQTSALYGLAGGVLNDPRIQKGNKAEVMSALKEAEQRSVTFGIPKEVVQGVFGQLNSYAESNHGSVKQVLGNIVQSGIGATGQQGLQTPQLATVGGAPATYTSGTGTAVPLNIGAAGGYTGVTPPNAQQPAVANQTSNAQPSVNQGVTQTQMQLSYPVRRAGDIRPLAPNEAVDTEKGASYRNALTARQTDLSASRRNLDEVIQAATQIDKEDLFSTGVLGAVTRTVKGWAGDPKYKQLSKDLANVQISNIQAQGGSMDTVAGQQLQKMANGDETYPPDVLIKIARRTYADLTNLDMQATAASKFAQKYGDSNLNTFKRQWSSNADSKVFEAMSIFENVKDKEKRNEAINKLFGDNPEQRQQYFQKYNNIKKLTATGEL